VCVCACVCVRALLLGDDKFTIEFERRVRAGRLGCVCVCGNEAGGV